MDKGRQDVPILRRNLQILKYRSIIRLQKNYLYIRGVGWQKKIDRASRERRGKEGKREKRYSESSGLAHDAKTEIVEAVAGNVKVATRGTACPGIKVPGTAA